jgi:hypothetical protein
LRKYIVLFTKNAGGSILQNANLQREGKLKSPTAEDRKIKKSFKNCSLVIVLTLPVSGEKRWMYGDSAL